RATATATPRTASSNSRALAEAVLEGCRCHRAPPRAQRGKGGPQAQRTTAPKSERWHAHLANPGATLQRAAVRRAAVPGGGRADTGVRRDGLHQSRPWRPVHVGRLPGGGFLSSHGQLLCRRGPGAAGFAVVWTGAGGGGIAPPLRARPPQPSAGNLRRDPVPERRREDRVGCGTPHYGNAGAAVGFGAADGGPALSRLPLRHHRCGLSRGGPALPPFPT